MPKRDSQNGLRDCLTGAKAVMSGLVVIFVMVGLASPAMAQAPADAVLIMHFDEGSGTIAKDESGNENDGAIHGATWATGISGEALSFDGRDDYINMGGNENLKMTNGLSVSVWVNMDTFTPTYQNIISDHAPNEVTEGSGKTLRFNYKTVQFIVGGVYGYGTAKYVKHSFDYSTLGKWQHVVGTYDKNKIRLFVNGIEVDSLIYSDSITVNSNPILIGKSGFGEFLQGKIDEVCIYNRALTEDEIKAQYLAKRAGGSIAALSLTKTASPYSIKQGQKTTVKITVENTGTTTLRDIEVANTLPADFDFISGETSNKYDMLKAGESRTFQYIIQSRDAGKFGICQATATYADEEGNYHTVESDHAMVEVIASLTTPEIPAGTPVPTLVTSTSTTSTPLPPGTPQITISQTSLLEEPSVGDEAMITVSLKNTGNSIAKNVQLTERIPSSVSVSYVEGADNAGGLVSWSGDLNPGQSRSIQHTFRILEAKNRFFTAKVTYEDAEGNKKETSTNVYITTAAEQPVPLDSDGDGWNDELEIKAGTNPYVKDTDNDGLWDSQDPNPLMAQETGMPGLPGFEIMFAVMGLLTVAYVLRRR